MIEIAPSILAADVMHMQKDIQRILDAGADVLHVDIMDGHFVPNLSYSPALVRALRSAFPDMLQDVHLMMTNPEKYLVPFAEAGAGSITIHAEIDGDVAAILGDIRAMGLPAGVSVKPGTPAETIFPYLALCDLVLIMTVEPGFGGQKMIMAALDKATVLRKHGYEGIISADGGIGPDNAHEATSRGVNRLVMGTALFKAADPRAAILKSRREAR